jgi:hypothetical protein
MDGGSCDCQTIAMLMSWILPPVLITNPFSGFHLLILSLDSQGYGLTETCAASFIAAADEIKHEATVGPPTPLTEFR